MSKRHLHIDFETYSEADLRRCGAEVYAEHPSTEVLLMGWAVDDGPVNLWEVADGPMPAEVRGMLTDPSVVKFAWNKAFEHAIFRHVLGIEIPHEQWLDPLVLAHSLSLPGGLGRVCDIVGMPGDEAKLAGTHLIKRFSVPRAPTKHKPWTRWTRDNDPKRWEEFKTYCKRDVEAERALWKRLSRFDMPPHEWENWVIDQKINQEGLPIDIRLIENALEMADIERRRLLDRATEITRLWNPNSVGQLLPWLKARGYPFDDLTKVSVRKALAQDLPPEVTDVLRLRQQWSMTSTRKLKAFKETMSADGRFRNAFQFAGAGRTWRWAGRKVQLQNLPRGVSSVQKDPETAADVVRNGDLETLSLLYDEPPMVILSSVLRGAIRAPDGYRFVVADLNAIENRVLGWLTGCDDILKVFRDGMDPYKSFAERWLKTPYDKVTKAQRTLSKPAVLGAGYMLSGGEYDEETDSYSGLWGYADSLGVKMTREEAHESVAVFRAAYDDVVCFWDDIMAAAKKCVRDKTPQEVGPLSFRLQGKLLRMRLPSGRYLSYVNPRIQPWKMPWGDVRPSLTYMGLNNQGQWVRQSTHPGKLTENADQAIARDVLMNGIRAAVAKGFTVVGHVHDEVITLVEKDSSLGVADLCACLCSDCSWANGLPLGAAGYISKVFKKD